tara:strand:+ start:103 stop:516 length:414 start_codon:yes stop_codon:yes gene_type:complete
MSKKRFLLPRNECWSYALQSIRGHIALKPSEAVFFMVDGVILQSSYNIGDFYSKYCEGKSMDDRLLVIDVFKENTFGSWAGLGAVLSIKMKVLSPIFKFCHHPFEDIKVPSSLFLINKTKKTKGTQLSSLIVENINI